jgi:tripartite-type tricarboxylate transporter receptor subunit TctC
MRCAALLLTALGLVGLGAEARAQAYPERAVKIIVPVGPGGSYDVVGRFVGEALQKRLGQGFVVENRPGAGTIIGTQAVATAQPDGYTLLVGGLSNVIFNAGLYKKLPYDPINDLVPVALVMNISYTLVANKDVPYRSAKDVVEAARKAPDSVKLANAGVGTGQHLFGAAFMRFTQAKLLEVPYRGSAAAFPDLIAGRVDLFFDSTPAAIPYIKSGQVKGLAVLAPKRNAQIPDVPTMTEAGIQGLEIDSWIGIFAPAKTPPEVIAKLQKTIEEALPELKPRFEQSGADPIWIAPDRLKGYIASEYEKWIKIIREAGIQLD